MTRAWAVGATLAAVLASAGAQATDSQRSHEVRTATERVLSDPRFQRQRPSGETAQLPPRSPSPTTKPWTPPSPPRVERGSASGVSTVLLWTLGGLLALSLVLVLANELVRARRRRRRKARGGDDLAGWVAEQHAQRLPASLARARELAAAGQYDEAAHELLTATLDYLKALAGFTLEPSHTSREVLASAPLDSQLTDALGDLVGTVEVSLFGGEALDARGYERCERAFLVLHDGLGHAR